MTYTLRGALLLLAALVLAVVGAAWAANPFNLGACAGLLAVIGVVVLAIGLVRGEDFRRRAVR
jgi:uncharacterized membrane protein